MEPLLNQVKDIAARLGSDPQTRRTAIIAVAVLAGLMIVGSFASKTMAPTYEYVFTNLDQQEQSDAATILRTAKIPFRVEGAGGAIAVESSRVYDARILLASEGIPRASGTGFELFDKSDLGVSEFTQKVNLQRAVEGELARTISGLPEVKDARIHIRMAERRLFQKHDDGAAASVFMRLFQGRRLKDEQVRGIQHLVAAAVPGLELADVSIVDGSGQLLSKDPDGPGAQNKLRREAESDLERRIMSVLEPVVGAGAVIARVAADYDTTEVNTHEESYDADNPAIRREQSDIKNQNAPGVTNGVVGAQGNVAGAAAGGSGPARVLANSEVKNYELSKKVVQKTDAVPRLTRLSVAVLVHETDPARPPEQLARLTELARRAVGFSEARGDKIEVSALPFEHAPIAPMGIADSETLDGSNVATYAGLGGLLLVLAAAGLLFVRQKRSAANDDVSVAVLSAGGRVAELETALAKRVIEDTDALVRADDDDDVSPQEQTPEQLLLDRARVLTEADAIRAAHLLRAWLDDDRRAENDDDLTENALVQS